MVKKIGQLLIMTIFMVVFTGPVTASEHNDTGEQGNDDKSNDDKSDELKLPQCPPNC